LSEELATGC